MSELMAAQTRGNEIPISLDAVFADDAQFRAWYDASLPRVFRYLYHRCGRNTDIAEELTQQTFVEAVRSRRTFDGADSTAWLIGIARHRLIDHLRRIERRERGLLRFFATQPVQVVWLGPDLGDDQLAAALGQLPAAQRAAVVLRYLDDLPVREVARLMSRTEKSVESLLSRGRESLRRIYGGMTNE